jgi:hypothetical protein
MKNISNSSTEISKILPNSKNGINSRKNYAKKNQIALRYVWYYEDPYIVIPKHFRELGIIE